MLSETGFNQLFHITKQNPKYAQPNLENIAKIKHFQLSLNNVH